jgi:hypothetical protein
MINETWYKIPSLLLFAVTWLSTPVTAAEPGGLDQDPDSAVIGSNRIRHREAARRVGRDKDPARKIPDGAGFDGEVSAWVELDADGAAVEISNS